MAKPGLLNVREHLKHAVLIEKGLKKYGYCPTVEKELKQFFFINRMLLRKAEMIKAKNRKDISLFA